ncbi:MAG: polysaccharide biosynthesis protein [Burkholderiales bacterium]|nr:polysaccharide biosynthesis protein [Burkholderiales bacterium]
MSDAHVREPTRRLQRLATRPALRTLATLPLDAVAAAAAWFAAFLLRFNLEIPDPELASATRALLWVVPVQLAALWVVGVYRGLWRYSGLQDLKTLALGAVVGAVVVGAGVYMLQVPLVPRSVLILDPILLVVLLGGLRIGYRVFFEHKTFRLRRSAAKPVLVLGAGDAGTRLVRALEGSAEWRVAGLLDDDPAKKGRRILGVPVLGTIAEVAERAASVDAEHVVIAMPVAAPSVRRRAADLAAGAGLQVLTVPAFDDLISGRVAISQLRQVEIEDLLGRDPVTLDTAGLSDFLGGKTVLVTGAGGSIGAELCRQIARFAPARLVLFELSEFALYELEQELSRRFPDLALACVVGDAKNPVRVGATFAAHEPEIVFHAAAYKHVPLMEDANAWEAVRNNTLGTYVTAAAAAKHGARAFVLISTDKAVNPANVMGASKRLAEMVCLALQRQHATKFVVVRFGNVLGSTGSVIPKFRRQIAEGGPVTVTHPDMMRYFMSIPEAAQLVLQAGLMGRGGEIFVLDMGDPVRIVDLARELIHLSGADEDEIGIVYTGVRPGEKLFEELLADGEATLATPHPKVRITRARLGEDERWLRRLVAWLESADALTGPEVRLALKAWVPEYRPANEQATNVLPLERRAGTP